MIRKRAVNQQFGSNTYLIGDILSKEAVVVDPSADLADILEMSEGFDIRTILITHCHFDHICTAEALQRITGARILAHSITAEMASDPSRNMSLFVGDPVVLKSVDDTLSEGDTVDIGENSLMVLETPGHSPGSLSFLNFQDRFALTGDTLFVDSVGRTDLHGGDSEQLQASLLKLMRAMRDDWRVMPGHGPEGFLWEIKKLNPFLPSLLQE